MSVMGPTDKDITKLHSEVNQIVNHRFLLTTVAMTLFGVITTWQIPKGPQAGTGCVGVLPFSASIILIALLFILFLHSHLLTQMLRNITTYLMVTENSGWEHDWTEFRKEGYLGYTKVQALVFLVLGFLSMIVPFVLAIAFSLDLEPLAGMFALIVVGLIYIILIYGMAFCKWFDSEETVRKRWKEMQSEKSHPLHRP